MQINDLEFKTTLVTQTNHILEIVLNRPDKKNAINPTMTNELLYALSYAEKTHEIRVVKFSASGDVFCSGGDLSVMKEEKNDLIPDMKGGIADIVKSIRKLCKPIVVEVRGNVYAGALLLIANATHVFASEHVKFSAPEIKRGIWPFMVMAGLFRVMNKRAGLDFIMRGNQINAVEAKEQGLITEFYSEKDIGKKVQEVVDELASLPPKAMKKGLNAFYKQEFKDFDEAMDFLEKQIAESLQSEEAQEGITAFLEKRPPNWK